MALNFDQTSDICPVCNKMASSPKHEIRLYTALRMTASRSLCPTCYFDLVKGLVELSPDAK